MNRLFQRRHDFVHASFADRTRDHPCVTESTSARAAAQDLHRDAVVDNVHVWHNKTGGWGRQLGNEALGDDFGNIWQRWFYMRDRPIFQIKGFVELRDVDTLYLRQCVKQLLTVKR